MAGIHARSLHTTSTPYHAVLRASALLTIFALMTPASLQAAERWFLMSRHGDCVDVGTLKRRIPDIGEVNDPDAFASFMRQKGYQVTSTRASVPKGKAHEVKVPEKELFLVFVTRELCGGSKAR
ncbi:MAG TPA: hypothetical protein VFU31_17145 [Candidatus Binatia bacterium]|nr:hypothetical protein [Candidatus Binatia bacterium]